MPYNSQENFGVVSHISSQFQQAIKRLRSFSMPAGHSVGKVRKFVTRCILTKFDNPTSYEQLYSSKALPIIALEASFDDVGINRTKSSIVSTHDTPS